MKVLELSTWTKMFSPEEMDSNKVQEYLDFIVQAAESYQEGDYSECHHVVPKCIDKESKYRDFDVRIRGRDHFTAHVMLVDCFLKDREKNLLTYAVTLMAFGSSSRRDLGVTPEEYERLRKVSSTMNPAKDPEIRNRMRGPRPSICGERNPNYQGKAFTPEVRKKISDSHTGMRYSSEIRRRRSESVKGSRNPFYGKHLSEEHKRRLAESRGTDEVRRKISESNKRYFQENGSHLKGRVWVHRGSERRMVLRADLESYLDNGWTQGSGIKK